MRTQQGAVGFSGPRAGQIWWWPVLVACGAVLLYGACFNGFTVPNADFFRFREDALGYLHGVGPQSFKRLPLFPLMIGLLSLVMPGSEPVLLAAELLNAALAPLALWLIFRVARAFVRPWTSLVIMALCAANYATWYTVTQPLQELTLLVFVLLTADQALRGSRWAYLAAALASVTRYEGAALIPFLMLQDWIIGPRQERLQRMVSGVLAGTGITLWMALSLRYSEMGNPYVKEILTEQGNPLGFAKGCLTAAWNFLPDRLSWPAAIQRTAWGAALGLVAIGLAVLVRRHGVRLIVIGGFLIGYGMIHTVFPAFVSRYAVPILWILYLAIGAAVEALPARLPPLLGMAGLSALLGFFTVTSWLAIRSEGIRMSGAQFRVVGEWYRTVAKPDDRMLVTHWRIVRYYSGLSDDRFLPTWEDLQAPSTEALLEELRDQGVTYVVWHSGQDTRKSYHRRKSKERADLISSMIERYPSRLHLVREFHAGPHRARVFQLRRNAVSR